MRATWPTHQWTLQTDYSRHARSTASAWRALAASDEWRQWEVKRGLFWQHDARLQLACSFLDEQRVRLVSASEMLARQLLHTVGVASSSLLLTGCKLLRT
jgi:hypothetical protein